MEMIYLIIDTLGSENMRKGKEGIKKKRYTSNKGGTESGEISISCEEGVNKSPKSGGI